MQNSRRCNICDFDVHRAPFANQLRKKPLIN